MSVTDHDTVSGCAAAAAAAATLHIEFVPGIEISAMRDDFEVHVLGYFVDAGSHALQTFLSQQRQRRIDRVRQMIDRLGRHGIRLDADAIVRPAIADPSKSVGRPAIARALVAGGYVASSNEAFDRWLERGRPAFVARSAPTPSEAIAHIHDARGIASLAHPGLLGRDEWLSDFAAQGLDAIEVYYTEHDAAQTAKYRAAAGRLTLAISGGSDYHADSWHGADRPGSTSLPREEYERLKERWTHRQSEV